jgi:hypothetical protein
MRGIGRSLRARIRAERAGGQPLDDGTRRALEGGFALDLSAIRVHTGPVAAHLTRALRADAFAAGAHLFFRAGAYRPDTEAGLRLLAHEVAHTIQQARGAVRPGRPRVPRRADPWELLADRAAAGVLAGRPVPLAPGLEAVPPTRADQPLVVQCHESYEHRALGDIPTPDIVEIAANQPTTRRREILERETKLMYLWHQAPEKVTKEQIAAICPWIRTICLPESELLVTYGELNALPDYIAQAQAIDTCPKAALLPILQVIRQESYNRLNALLGSSTAEQFAGSPFAPDKYPIGAVNKVLESWALDSLTQNLGAKGIDHYSGLLARNACHFAPFTWHRWQASYLAARSYATASHAARDTAEKARLKRLAWTYHGYADHFLQDSFAAGHLINKTLVMQWFVDWAAPSLLFIEDWALFKDVTAKNQPHMAGRQLYDPAYAGLSTDPQTVQEQASYAARLELSGVAAHGSDDKNAAYQQYLTFLSSAITQLSSNAIHDYYNEHALWVASAAHPTPYQVWGDDTLLRQKQGGAPGAQLTSETAQLSQQSIQEVLDTGDTKITTQALRDRFPSRAGDDEHHVVALQTWVDSKKGWTEDNIFDDTGMLLKRIVSQGYARILNLSLDQEFANRWYISLPDAGFDYTDTVTMNGRLFAGSAGLVFELDPDDGHVLHSLQISRSGDETHVATDGTMVFAGCYGYAYGIRLDDWSKTAWTAPMTGASYSPVELLSAGGRLFAGSNGAVLEIDPATGARRQAIDVSSAVGEDVHLATDGRLVFAGCHGYAYGIALDDWSKIAWSTPMAGVLWKEVALVHYNGHLYAGTNGFVLDLNATSGAVRKSVRLSLPGPGWGEYTPAIVLDEQRGLFVGMHGYLYNMTL